ncbi:hypothetical protein [Leeuwenhoekiella sp. NPDC079379]|uniref:hypothetical protein n=1 Tax=Leeuwenhoekiella sp. NPDC079379 TaxID=3364122 RepID=UPI0037C7D14F
MSKLLLFITSALIMVFQHTLHAQETINANNSSSFILGGGQEVVSAVLDLQPIHIVDLEPENAIPSGNTVVVSEAGKPFVGIGSPSTGDFWLNFTYRGANFQNARIYASTNLPIPSNMTITLQVINTASINGQFAANPNLSPVSLSTTDQVLVYDFANGFTGDGENTGYQIRYQINNPNALSLPSGFEMVFEIK